MRHRKVSSPLAMPWCIFEIDFIPTAVAPFLT
jgi:hypothetical protein